MQVLTRTIRLNYEATLDLHFASPLPKAYKFVAKNGSFIRVQEGEKPPEDLCVNTWGQARAEADLHGVDFIAVMHEHRVLFRFPTTDGKPDSWLRALTVPDARAVYDAEGMTHDQFPPDPDKPRRKRKYPSGAQKKKRRRLREQILKPWGAAHDHS